MKVMESWLQNDVYGVVMKWGMHAKAEPILRKAHSTYAELRQV